MVKPTGDGLGGESRLAGLGEAQRLVAGLKAVLRTQYALILREARVRHGRSRIGYAWAIFEPFAVISVMTLFFAGLGRGGPLSSEFPIFFATGVLPFQYFRHSSSFIGMALEANMPLFNYPTVREFDAALARLMLETITSLVIVVLVFCFMMAVFSARLPVDVGKMLIAYCGLGLLALGVGLNIAVLQRRFSMTHYIYNMVMTPAFFISGLFFSIESVAPEYRLLLVWNPIIHGIEAFRAGYYPIYSDQHVSLSYLYFVGLVLLFVGMLQLMVSRRDRN
ncbi:ABC transporter permease [Phaeovulum sp.]|uniref:ABC transporter permease n=1 Tax=Phaeovulum sp. TaxID=2934796 RepID=UPI00272F5CB3|nr:ABC transporter permease [Phaeovulum sp.]MDP1667531.1 ABC transporter permease [Phaeovulum sp.]MDZ4120048.1 ABC transporter permease [Phaeovulum sp.]